jgi:tetratricopeptide (TPR) repeat protein
MSAVTVWLIPRWLAPFGVRNVAPGLRRRGGGWIVMPARDRRLRGAVGVAGGSVTWRANGDDDRAIADYTEAIRLNPNYANALYWRGVAKQREGDKDVGDADIAAAKRIDPKAGN